MTAHTRDVSDPSYQRGATEAQIALRHCSTRQSVDLLHRHADGVVAEAEQRLTQAQAHVAHAHGFRAHLTEQETPS